MNFSNVGDYLTLNYDWDELSAANIWTFGPDNMVLNIETPFLDNLSHLVPILIYNRNYNQ